MRQFSEDTYRPVQSFNAAASYESYVVPPHHSLYRCVREFWQFNLSDLPEQEFLCLPDGCIDLFFFIGQSRVSSFALGTFPRAGISPLERSITAFGIRFYTGSFGMFFNVPANTFLTELIVPPKDLINTNELGEQLAELETFCERIALCTRYFGRYLDQSHEVPEMVRFAVASIVSHEGSVRVSQLVEQTGYSERYIRKMFERYVGLSPKALCEVVSLQEIIVRYHNTPGISMDALAYENGYFDLSHMYKRFKTLLGNSPKAALRQLL